MPTGIPVHRKIRRRRPLLGVWLAGGGLLALATALAIHQAHRYFSEAAGDATLYQVGVLAGIAAAIIGWMVNAWISFRNRQKQHTIDLLFQSRLNNEIFSRHQSRLVAHFPPEAGARINKVDFDRLSTSSCAQDRELAAAIRYMLNYYEFIAAGVKHGDLDIGLLGETIRDNLNYTYALCRPLILEMNKHPRYLRNLTDLYGHWQRPDT
jgi:hypothetical protein